MTSFDPTPVIAGALTAFWCTLIRLDVRDHRVVTTDGMIYLQAGRGEPVPRPFSRRWLLPRLLGDRAVRWDVASTAAMIACGPLVAAYAGGPMWQQLAACCLFLGCPGIFRMNVACPVHVDPIGHALALAAALCAPHHPVIAVALSLAGGACVERAPVFAAIFAWNPWLLLGLLAPAWRRAGAPATEPWLTRPFRYALERHRGSWLAWREMVMPWGALALLMPLGAALDLPTLIAVAALAVGYGQMFIATDRARLYQWAAPALIAVAVRALPDSSLTVAILVVHLFNPYRLYGI
jgi:hypothetical protein